MTVDRKIRSNIAISAIIGREGNDKYTNDPDDPGGPTKWGVTQKALSAWRGRPVSPEEVQALERFEAEKIFLKAYIEDPRIHEIEDTAVFNNVADASVVHGSKTAIRFLQRALAMNWRGVDGIIGPKTLAAVNDPDLAMPLVVKQVKTERANHIFDRVERGKSNPKYLKGWILRTISV